MHIEYISKSGNSVREVAPIGIYAYDGFWYMPGFDLARRETRLFRTDRIQTLNSLNRTYDPKMSLDAWLIRHPVQESAPPLRLYVELNREGIRQCRSQPWLEPNIVMRNEDLGFIDTTIVGTEIEYVSHYFYRLGTSAKVMEPQEIVSRIRLLAEEVLQHYK